VCSIADIFRTRTSSMIYMKYIKNEGSDGTKGSKFVVYDIEMTIFYRKICRNSEMNDIETGL
jgi:hypothetical protein